MANRITVISHFYNEEYLLPWWLDHHKKLFDHGVMIDYGSTDKSVSLIRKHCPNWEILRSVNNQFNARLVDEEISSVEKGIFGWRICLNITEFLVGNVQSSIENVTSLRSFGCTSYKTLANTIPRGGVGIPVHVMVDVEPEVLPDYNKPLIFQKTYGIHFGKGGFKIRKGRLLHANPGLVYQVGRHYDCNTSVAAICWYGWSPFNSRLLERKLQIKKMIPDDDRRLGYGVEHFMSPFELYCEYKDILLPKAENLLYTLI
jgi:hypothetical protein